MERDYFFVVFMEAGFLVMSFITSFVRVFYEWEYVFFIGGLSFGREYIWNISDVFRRHYGYSRLLKK